MAQPASYYDKDYFDTYSKKGYPGPYTTASAPWDRLARALVLTFGPSIGVKSCADFGCARGFVIYYLQNLYGWQTKGYDFSKYALKTAMPGLDLELADITRNKPFAPADLVLCMDVLEHIDEAKLPKAIQNLRDATKKVAVFHVLVPKGKDKGSWEYADDHVTVEPKDWWQAMFEANGFRRHWLEPTYRINIRRLVKGPASGIWMENAFVLEPVIPPAVTEEAQAEPEAPAIAPEEPVAAPEAREQIEVPWPMNVMATE